MAKDRTKIVRIDKILSKVTESQEIGCRLYHSRVAMKDMENILNVIIFI